MSDRMVALYALRTGDGRWLRFIGEANERRLPIHPRWRVGLFVREWLDAIRPATRVLCRKLGADVLFVVGLKANARGLELRAKLERRKSWSGSSSSHPIQRSFS